VSDDGPSISVLAGQLDYLFEDEPTLRTASDAELAARISRDDRFARARQHYPMLSDAEVAAHLDEFDERITAEHIHAARARMGDTDD
jgi:hypothetical protein